MINNRHTSEQVINKMRQAEVQVLTGQYRQTYNRIRPHS